MVGAIITSCLIANIEMNAAQIFCDARRAGYGLATWPGALPETIEAAYALQAEAIAGWGDAIGGLKVGRIMGADAQHFCVDRFIGPIFASTIYKAKEGRANIFPVVSGGTAMLECEILMELGSDVSAMVDNIDIARLLVGSCHIGIEVAGSPMDRIGELGPLASIACFGNNNGAILGPAIPDWQSCDLDAITCTARIDGQVVGEGSSARLPGGVWAGAVFAINAAVRRGIGLRRGAVLSVGAMTGMHPLAVGQLAEADFGVWGRVVCRAEDAVASIRRD